MRSLSIALLVVASALDAQTSPPTRTVARVADSLGAAFIADRGAPGIAVGVMRGTDTILFKAWGSANLEQDVAATAQSVYRIGSVTKQFTSSAVMQLVEQGKVRLDDSIAVHLTELPAAWRPVTVRQLLNHTSGIPSYTDIGPTWAARWGEEMTPDTLLALTAGRDMWFAPGSNWRYDNTGYVLLGMLIEKVAGRTWATDIEERFSKPLGLSDTRNCMTEPLISRRVAGYGSVGATWVNAPFLAMSQPYAAGAMCSTVRDLARWNRALHLGKVVSATSYAAMTTPEGAAGGRNRYGFGLIRDTIGSHQMIVHGGGIHGFTTANAWVPGSEVSVTVLSNSSGARVNPLMRQLVRAALGIPLDQPPRVQPLSAQDRAKYVGVYSLALPGGARDFTIAEGADGLTAQLAGQGANPIIFYGNHTFGANFDPTLRLVFTVAGERATSVRLLQGGGSFDGPRK